jgi:hypothetical protein
MITRPLIALIHARPRVRDALDRQVGAPPALVGTLIAGTARPGAAEDLVAAVLQRAPLLGGLRLSKGDVAAGRLVASRQVDEGRRTIVPGNRGVRTGVVPGVAVAHFGCFSLSRYSR